MKRRRFAEEQTIGITREQETGETAASVRHRHGIRSATFYKSKAKGMDASDAKSLKALENAKLKKLLP